MRFLRYCLLIIVIYSSLSIAHAEQQVKILFSYDDMLILIDENGRQIIYTKNKDQPDAIPLKLRGPVIQTQQVHPAEKENLVINADERGLYVVNGEIHNRLVTFLIDTGASHVTMNSIHARRLGIDYKKDGVMVQVDTASGREVAYALRLKDIKVGDIKLHNVAALILEGHLPRNVLLGMSFLENLEMKYSGGALHIQQQSNVAKSP